jgi:hypothetical protein
MSLPIWSTLKLLFILAGEILNLCGGWQSMALKETVVLNNLLRQQNVDQAKARYGFDFPATRGLRDDMQVVAFSGTKIYPFAKWTRVEVRLILKIGSTQAVETVIWDLTPTLRVIHFAIQS